MWGKLEVQVHTVLHLKALISGHEASSQACNRGIENWNVAKGSLKRLKIFFFRKSQNCILFFYFMSKSVLE